MARNDSNRLLRKRLKEIDRERASLLRRIDTLSKLPDGVAPEAPPAPRIRPPAIPEEWRITRPEAARRADAARAARVAAVVVPRDVPEDSPEFAPAPRGVRFQPNARSRRPSMLRADVPSAIGESAPPTQDAGDRLGTYLGAQPAYSRPRRRGHVRSAGNEGSFRARAVFAVLMLLLLGFLAIRLFT